MFYLVKQGNNVFWAKQATGSLHWIDYRLFKIPQKCDDEILKTSLAENFEDLNWNGTTIVDPSLDSGWISPVGDFIGCKPFNHDAVAIYYLRTKVVLLEMAGWVRVHSFVEGNWVCQKELTPYQLNTIERKKLWS